jgi:hypothetical protein
MTKARKTLKPGDLVSAEEPNLKDWIATGFVVSCDPVVPVVIARGAPVSLWNLDPALLRRKSLDQLNIMIRERDATALLESSRDAAIKKLSSGLPGI